MSSAILQVRDLRTYFYTTEGIVRAVDGVSYDLHEGETMALVGESGSGKSVSAFSLLRLVPHPGKIVGGQAIFNGEDLLTMSQARIRSIRGTRISIVFQEPMTSLSPVMSIGQQIAEPLKAHLKMKESSARRRAVELLNMVGIPDGERRYRDYPHQFSGGMRQRVMMAMSLCCNPKILIADEPTTALDVTIQAQILDLMMGLTRDLGTAIMLITHNLGIVARYADTVNVMQNGKIVESASADALFARPTHPYTQRLLQCVPRIDIK